MQLITLGAPGTGKGTQGKLLSEYFKIPNISTGEILRSSIEHGTELGNEAKNYMDKGELVPDEVMIGLIKERLLEDDCANGFILDGFPRTVKQAQALDKYLVEINKALDYVLGFELPSEKIIARLTSRRICNNCGKDYNVITNPPPSNLICTICGGEIIQRSDDSEETISNRLKVYEEKTKPLIEYFEDKGMLVNFSAEGEVSDIQDEIRDFLSKK